MNFILITKTENYTIPLNDAAKLWAHNVFDKNKKTVILVTGWTSNINATNEALNTISAAYMCRGNINFVVSNLL